MADDYNPHANWPFPKPEYCTTAADLENNILRDEIERLTHALHYEQHFRTRVGTHGPGCYKWGPAHYECALRKIKGSGGD